MKICYSCSSKNSATAKFCKNCGVELKSEMQELPLPIKTEITKCFNCGSDILPNAKFCRLCGSKLLAKEETREFKLKDAEAIEKLECKHGCGGTLKETEDPEIFKCEFCGSRYLVKRQAGSLKIIREIERRLNGIEAGVNRVVDTQKLLAMKENAHIDLYNLEEWYRNFKNDPFLKLFKSITICGVILLVLGILISDIRIISDFGRFLSVCGGLIITISSIYWWIRYKKHNHYIIEKARLTDIIKRKLEV